MTDIILREALPADAEPLADCIDSAYETYKDEILDLPDVSAGLSLAIREKTVWVAEKENIIVGGMILDRVDDYLVLENVAVHPNASGSGVGKALIDKAETECRRIGLREIRLSTHKAMSENVGLYEYLGWSVFRIDGNKVHMTRQVSQTP